MMGKGGHRGGGFSALDLNLQPVLFSFLHSFVFTGSDPEQNPCFTGRHGCDINAACRPAEGLQFSCQCAAGFIGDGRYCHGNAVRDVTSD